MLSHRIFGEFMQRAYYHAISNHKPFYNTQIGVRLYVRTVYSL